MDLVEMEVSSNGGLGIFGGIAPVGESLLEGLDDMLGSSIGWIRRFDVLDEVVAAPIWF